MNFRFPVASYATAFIVVPLTACAFAATAKPAEAQVLAYTLGISGNTNVPVFTLSNDSTVGGVGLTGITLTIGNTAQNFDAAYLENVGTTGIGFTRLSPDNNDSGAIRADFLQYTFTGFDPGESFIFSGDIDDDNVDSTEDYRVVLFNNGDAVPNSVLTVNFSNGASLSQSLSDQPPGLQAYSFSQSTGIIVAAPEPGTLALLGAGLLPIMGAVLRRRHKSL